jgi:hypothetical protein
VPCAALPNNICCGSCCIKVSPTSGRRPRRFSRDVGPTYLFLASGVWTNRDRANDHIAHEASALTEAGLLVNTLPPDVPTGAEGTQRTSSFHEAEDWRAMASGHTAQHRALVAIEQALKARRHGDWMCTGACQKDTEAAGPRGRGRRRYIAIRTIPNRWQATSGRYRRDVWWPEVS